MAVGVMWSWAVAALVTLTTICIALRSSKGLASMPFIGDSIQFFRAPRDLLVDRFKRHGDPYYFWLLGKRHTVVNTPEAFKFVLSTAHGSFSPAYMKQVFQLVGRGKFYKPGNHPYNRRAVLSAVTGDGLQSLLPFINTLAANTVKKWERMEVVNTVEEADKYVFKVGMHVIWRDVDPESEDMEMYKKGLEVLTGGLTVVPINLPGFYFHKAMKIRATIISRIQESISRRRAGEVEENDLVNALMNMKEVELSDEDVCDSVLNLMFVASVTTASLLPFVLKYLHDFPDVRQRVQEEHESFRERMAEDPTLTWFKPKSSMPYTLQVFYEVLRVETIVPFVPRLANKDVDFNGNVFRKGSPVWASLAAIHMNPEYYPNPEEFNPSRFEEKPKPNTYLPFGQGPRVCPGSELAITEAMFLVHHLITNYRWERIGPNQGVADWPTRRPKGGFPVTITKK